MDQTHLDEIEIGLYRYCASQQVIAGTTILAGRLHGQRAAESMAIVGNAVGVLLMAQAQQSAGGPKSAVFAWFATLAALAEAHRRGTTGAEPAIALLGLAGAQAWLAPKQCYSVYKAQKPASAVALAFLSLGGANQLASTVYLSIAKARGHAHGLFFDLLLNAVAAFKFASDSKRAGFKTATGLTWGVLVSVVAGLVRPRAKK